MVSGRKDEECHLVLFYPSVPTCSPSLQIFIPPVGGIEASSLLGELSLVGEPQQQPIMRLYDSLCQSG